MSSGVLTPAFLQAAGRAGKAPKWNIGGLYRVYCDQEIISGACELHQWFGYMLAYESSDATRELLETFSDYAENTQGVFTVTLYDADNDEWKGSVISVSLNEILEPGIDSNQYNEIKEQLQQSKEEYFDDTKYIYISGFALYPQDTDWSLDNLGLTTDDLATLVYPFIPTDEYIEEYPKKITQQSTNTPTIIVPDIPNIGGGDKPILHP